MTSLPSPARPVYTVRKKVAFHFLKISLPQDCGSRGVSMPLSCKRKAELKQNVTFDVKTLCCVNVASVALF